MSKQFIHDRNTGPQRCYTCILKVYERVLLKSSKPIKLAVKFNGGHILKLQYHLSHWGHPPGQVVLDETEMVSQEELQIYHC